MKLDIDLNKLNLEQLETVLALAKKGSKESIEEIEVTENKSSKPIFRRRKRQLLYFEQEISKITNKLLKHKKGLSVSKLVIAIGRTPSGTTNRNLKTILEKHKEFVLVGNKWCLQSILSKPDLRVDRAKFLGTRANQLMKADVTMSREKAFVIASGEWKEKGKSVNIKSSQFDWVDLFSIKGEEIRQLYYQKFRQNKVVSYADFNFLGFENEALYQLSMIKLLKNQEQVLSDLGLKGSLSYSNGVMMFKGVTQ